MDTEVTDMDGVAHWLERRKRRSLARVRLAALGAAALLLLGAGWIAWRQAGLLRLPQAVQTEVYAQENLGTVLTLKRLSLIAHLAKVRRNALLATITGSSSSEAACAGLKDLRGLPQSSPCRVGWEKALMGILSSVPGDVPPTPEEEFLHDRWGAPYILNEAEETCVTNDWCPEDVLRSAGPDGTVNTPDDLIVTIPRHLYLYKAPK